MSRRRQRPARSSQTLRAIPPRALGAVRGGGGVIEGQGLVLRVDAFDPAASTTRP
jgi:hypothetical protein